MQALTLPKNNKLTLDVYHLYDEVSHMLLFSAISIFFENTYMGLSLFFPSLRMMLVDSIKNIPEFIELLNFLFMLKIFLLL